MTNKLFLIIFLFFLMTETVISVQLNITILEQQDFENKVIDYKITSDKSEIKGNSLSNALLFDLEQGFYDITLTYDYPETGGYDLWGTIRTEVKNNTIVKMVLLPIGSIDIKIIDKNNNALKNVPIKIECDKKYGLQGYYYTDEFGSVRADFLPVSSCIIKTSVEEFIYESNINITQGTKSETIIKFKEYSSDKKNNGIILLIGIVTFIIIAHIIVVKIKKKKNTTKKNIVQFLDSKEQKIINFLIDELQKNPDGYVNQNKIIYGTGIAKTSIIRILENLKRKDIITIEKIGKMKKIKFTENFNKK